MKKTLSLIVLLLFTACGSETTYDRLNRVLEQCDSESLMSVEKECLKNELLKNDDMMCEFGECCGGNSIGWYQCF